MATVPVCALCRPAENLSKFLENKKKTFLKINIFIVLLIEWLSYAYIKTYTPVKKEVIDVYTDFLYPLLTQLVLGILFLSFFLWKDRLYFCFRKSATTFYLSVYYFLGFFSILFCLNASIYYEIVSISILGVSTFLFIVSLWKSSQIK
ncbi:MAG: hypothetical protein CMP76_17295 [Flavobacterium sp.]|uniref:hypothetical protein n=1 Tax=Flavobacterium sp. TaxID=239 RepID=UPI000C444679|nr:hypothetical protein [Flavobacterium sp.]MBF05035.1 hypothetical protein [Flavobacterium sp.]|tara:strand:- start:1800 stop:2243 length:444 start_codon:yes stop_codon:yes gene_type:complete